MKTTAHVLALTVSLLAANLASAQSFSADLGPLQISFGGQGPVVNLGGSCPSSAPLSAVQPNSPFPPFPQVSGGDGQMDRNVAFSSIAGVWMEFYGGQQLKHTVSPTGWHTIEFLSGGRPRGHQAAYDGQTLTLLDGRYQVVPLANGNLQLLQRNEKRTWVLQQRFMSADTAQQWDRSPWPVQGSQPPEFQDSALVPNGHVDPGSLRAKSSIARDANGTVHEVTTVSWTSYGVPYSKTRSRVRRSGP